MSVIGSAPIQTPVRARRTLLSSCAVASALVVMGHAAPAAADGYNATISGSTNYSGPTTANLATINLTNTNTVLTWSPTQQAGTGSINFQDATNANGSVSTTTFVGPRGAQDYSVLNRIIPTDTSRSVTFNGTTLSVLGDGATRGGQIWFYSPGGIIASGTARFDVGSLLLSTNEITFENGYGTPGRAIFDGAVGGTSAIQIQSGAVLSATGNPNGNYVALVAPRVDMAGTVNAKQAAYVAAEAGQIDLNISAGLFNITVTPGRGTSVANAISHTGNTQLSGTDANQLAYLVAVPKNDAITMLLAGNVTTSSAASATAVADGTVILSTGYSTNAAGPSTAVVTNAQGQQVDANIAIGTAGGPLSSFRSINAATTGTITTPGNLQVVGDVTFAGDKSVAFGASGPLTSASISKLTGGTGGNLNLTSFTQAADGSRTGGSASLYAGQFGLVTIAGAAVLDTSGIAQAGRGPTGPLNGTGGISSVTATAQLLTVGDGLTVRADGAGANGGIGRGGSATVTGSNGSLSVGRGLVDTGAGDLIVSANGLGGTAATAGAGIGGTASITADGRAQNINYTVRVGGTTTVSATGTGGTVNAASSTGGAGTGGTASVALNAVTTSPQTLLGAIFTGDGAVTITAAGTGTANTNGAFVSSGGAGTGGTASLALTNSSLSASVLVNGVTAFQPLSVSAAGTGGDGNSSFSTTPAAGGAGTGGSATVSVAGGGLGVSSIGVSATGLGGAGGSSQVSGSGYGLIAGAAGGASTGGRAVLDTSAPLLDVPGGITVDASAQGGAGGQSGTTIGGAGGSATAGGSSQNFGTVTTPLLGGAYLSVTGSAQVTTSGVSVRAVGTGGAGGSGLALGQAGDGGGGNAVFTVQGTSGRAALTSTSPASVSAEGFGGSSGYGFLDNGGVGTGGGTSTAGGAQAVFDNADIILDGLTVSSAGTGVSGGTGGATSLAIQNGAALRTQDLTPDVVLTLSANGVGTGRRTGANAGTGASGTGGSVAILLDAIGQQDTPFVFGQSFTASADGTGYGSENNGTITGGSGTGGAVNLTVRGNSAVSFAGGMNLSARGTGGAGFDGDGGAGQGGSLNFTVDNSAVTAPSLQLLASGIGGGTDSAGDIVPTGGAGTGGAAGITLSGTANATLPGLTITGTTTIDASGTGGFAGSTGYGGFSGYGGIGGTGTGGGLGSGLGAYVDVQSGTAALGPLTLNAGGTGGGSVSGGAGGTGMGGKASLTLGTVDAPGGTLMVSSLDIGAAGAGGDHSSGYGSPGGAGGAGTGGSAALTMNGGTLTNTGRTTLTARGTGADGSDQGQFDGQAAGAGGAGTGGSATVTVTGGTLTTAGLDVSAGATGGFGGFGSRLTSGAGGAAIAGGAADSAGVPLNGSTGAAVTVSGAQGAIILSGNLNVTANARGGDGGSGFDEESGAAGGAAQGGAASIAATGGAAIGVSNIAEGTITASLAANADGGYGGGGAFTGNTPAPIGGAGGNATGGALSLTSSGGSTVRLGNLAFDASASGGYGAPDVMGGNAIGGSAMIRAQSGAIEATDPAVNSDQASVFLDLHAFGGQQGGSATGGSATITSFGPGGFTDDMLVDTSATGSDGVAGHLGTAGGAGGSAIAGDFTVDLGTGTIDGLTILANAVGGRGGNAVEAGYGAAGGNGGAAGGGTISLTARSGATINLTSITAARTGGAGGDGSSNTTDGTPGANGIDGVRGSPQGINGTDGQRGGAGQAGGRGGDGGSATGTSLSLFASQGSITLNGGEGTSTIDLSVTGGNGGAGGNGSNGGSGGTGGAGAPASTDGQGNPLPAGLPGNDGPVGLAGAGGDAGNGGDAFGEPVVLRADGGTLSLGNLTLNTIANGSGTGLPGQAGGGDLTGIDSVGFYGLPGQAGAGNVTIATSDVNIGDGTSFGRIIGGALTIDASGSGGASENGAAFQIGIAGQISLLAGGRYLSDDTDPVGSIALNSLNITAANHTVFGDFITFSSGSPDFARVNLFADGGRISIVNGATLAATDDVSLRAGDGGQIRVGDQLNVNANDIATSQTGGSSETPSLIAATGVTFFAGNSIVAASPIVATRNGDAAGTISFSSRAYLQADDLTATDSISITAGNVGNRNVSTAVIGNLRTTALANPDAPSLDEAGGGTIDITVGEQFLTSLLPNVDLADANLEVTGTVQASNRVTMTAGGDVAIRGGAQVLSDNLVRLDAGDNVQIDSGATVRAALNPLADPVNGTGDQDLASPAGLSITAGVQTVAFPGLLAGDVPSIIVAGTVTSGVVANDVLTSDTTQRRSILLHGQAIQTEGSAIGGRSLSVEVQGAPATSDFNDDFGTLTNGCYGGDACLGALDLTNLLTVGGLTGTDVLPTNVRIQSGSDTVRTVIRAQDSVTLGTDGGATSFGASDLIRVQALGGQVNLLGATTVQNTAGSGGTVQILGESGIEGASATIANNDAVGLYTGSGGLTLGSLTAARIDGLNADTTSATTGSLSVAGAITINNLLSLTAADIDLSAGGDVSINQGEVADGGFITLQSSGGNVGLFSAGRSGFGTPTDIAITSSTGAATLNNATAQRDIRVSAATDASAANITAGDDIFIDGTTATLGAMNTDGSFVESGYGDGSNIAVTTTGDVTTSGLIDAFDTLRITSSAGLVSADTLTAGDDVIVSGNTLSIASVTSRGTSLENGYGATPDGSNISLTATGAGAPSLFVGAANAFQDLTLLASDPAGTTGANSLAAGRDLSVQAGASISNVPGTAGRDFRIVSTNGAVTGSTLSAVRDLAVSAATFIDLTNGNAGRDLRLTAGTNAGATGTLSAGDDITVSGATVSIGSLTSTGTGGDSESDGSNIAVTAPGAIAITGTANAFGDLTIASSGGRVTANILTAGDDVAASGTTLNIASATSRGAATESGYGATPDGSNITLTANGPGATGLPAIVVGSANAARDLTLDATNAAFVADGDAATGSIAATTLAAGRDIVARARLAIDSGNDNAGRDVLMTSSGANVTGGTVAATRDIIVAAANGASLASGNAGRDLGLAAGTGPASGGSLSAGDDITVSGATVSIGSLTSTGTGGDSESDGSNIAVTAPGVIAITGTANAFGDLTIASSGGRVTANILTAGDDVAASGTTLNIASATSRGAATESGYGATPDGSNITLTASAAGAITLPSLVVATANAARDLTLQATNPAGTISATTLSAGRDIAATAGGALGVTGGTAARDLRLTAGASAQGGTLTAGDDIFVDGASVAIGAANTTGAFVETGADGSNITIGATGAIGVTGVVDAFDTLRLTSPGGTITANQPASRLTAGNDVSASGAALALTSVVSRGTSGEPGGPVDGSNIVLSATGADAGGVAALQVTGADAANDFTATSTNAGGSILGGPARAGRDILISGPGPVALADGNATRDLTLASTNATATGGTLVAARDLTLRAGTAAGLTAGTAGDDILVTGATVSIGSATTTGAFAETGYGADGSNIAVTAPGAIAITGTANAFGDLTIASSGGRVTANILTAGDDVAASGTTLNIASATSRGAATESGYGATPDGSNITLTANGPGATGLPAIVVGSANAARDLTLDATNAAFVADGDAATGSIAATTLAAGRDIVARARLAIDSGNDNAGRDVLMTSSGANVTGGTVAATRDIIVAAANGASLASGNAGRDLGLAAGTGPASGGSLSAGDDITVSGATVSIGSLTSTGTGGDSESDGSNIAVTAPGVIAITGTANAFGDLTIASSGGRVTANILTAGDDVAASGTTLNIASATSRGAATESGYGATPDGSNITLTASAAGAITLPSLVVATANAARDLTLQATNPAGTISATTLSAGRDIAATAGGALGVTGGTAARDLRLTAGASAQGGTLTAGDDIFVDGASVAIGAANTTGAFVETGADGSNITIGATGAIGVTGVVDAFDTLRLTSPGGTITANQPASRLTAGNDVSASGAALALTSVVSRGTSGEPGGPVDGSNIVLSATGADAGGVAALQVTGADAANDFTATSTNAGGSILGGPARAGRDILISGPGPVALADGNATRDLTLASTNATATGGTLVAARDLTLRAGTAAGLTAGTAGDDILVTGATVSIGSATTTGAFAETGYGADGSNIAVTAPGAIAITGTANAFGDLTIASSGGRVTANILTAGDDVAASGTTLNIASATSRGAATESGYGATPDGSNITLTANGPGATGLPAIVVGSANAARDLTLDATNAAFVADGDAATGSIAATTLAAGRDIVARARLAIDSGNDNAGRDVLMTSSGANVTGGTVAATRDIIVAAANGASLASGNAGRDLGLAAGTGPASGGSLSAGDDITVSGATVSIGSLTSTGTGGDSESDGSNIAITAPGVIAITGTANAFGDLTIASSGGRVTANILTAGDDVAASGTTLNIASATSRGAATESGYGATPDGSNITLTASAAGAITLPSLVVATANAARDLTLQATNPAGTISATTLSAGRDIAATAGGALGVTGGTAARDISLTSTNNVLTATSLTAGRNLGVAALGTVTLGDAVANGPLVLAATPTDPIPASGLVTISAGRSGTTGTYGAADILLNGTVRAAGHVLATAGRDIVVGPAARVQSDNRVTLNAGDDILIRSGAVVSAALAPATLVTTPTGGSTIVSPAALVLNAGSLALGYTPAAGNVASLIVDGSLNSASRPVLLTAGVIQADASALNAGSLSIDIGNAPAAGAAQSDDGGQLRLGCLQGDVCLGAVTLTGFTAGTTAVPGDLLIGGSSRPTNVRIAGAVNVGAINIVAQDSIFLGSATATTPIAQTASGRVSLNAVAGSINLLGNLTLTGGAANGTSFSGRTVSLDAGTDVAGAAANIVSRGPLSINVGRSVTLASTSSAEATQVSATVGNIGITSLTTTAIENSGDGPGSGVILTAGGSVSGIGGGAATVDAVGDVFVRAGGDVSLGTVAARNGASATDLDGSDIDIVAGGAVSLASGAASDDAFFTAGQDLTIGTLSANGETDNDTGDTHGGYLRLAGDTISAGSLNATTLIDGRAATFLRVDDARSPGTISFSAAATDLPAWSGSPDGVPAVELGTVDAGTQLTIGAANGGIRFAGLAAPTIALDAATRIAGGDATARAGDFTATAAGDIALGTVNATDNIAASAGGAFSATSLSSAIDSPSNSPRRIDVDAGSTIDIGTARADRGTVRLTAGAALNLGSGSAADAVLLTSRQDQVTTGALVAGTFPAANDGENYSGGVMVDAATNATVASANALGDVIVVARTGDIAIGDITTGANALLFAANNASAGAVQATQRVYVAGPATLDAFGDGFAATLLDGITPTAAGGSATLNGPVTAASATVAAAQGIGFGTIATTGTTNLAAIGGPVTGAAITAGDDIVIDGATVSIGSARTTGAFAEIGYGTDGSNITVTARGAIDVSDTADAFGDLTITSQGGRITAAMLTAGDDAVVSGGTLGLASVTSRGLLPEAGYGAAADGSNIRLTATGVDLPEQPALAVTNADAFQDLTLAASDAAGSIAATTLAAGRDIGATAGAAITAAGSTAGRDLGLTSISGGVSGSALSAGRDLAVSGQGAIGFATADAATGAASIVSNGGAIALDRVTAGTSVAVASGTGLNGSPTDARSVTLGTIRAGTDATVRADGAIAVGSATAGGSIFFTGATTVALDAGTSGLDTTLEARAAARGGTLVAGRDLELITRYTFDQVVLPRSVTLTSGMAGDDLVLAAFGRVEAGTLVTTGLGADAGNGTYGNRPGSSVYLISERGTQINSISSAGDIDSFNTAQTINGFQIGDGSGGLTIGSQRAGGSITAINLASGINFDTATAGGGISISGGGQGNSAIAANMLSAGGVLTANTNGDVTVGTATGGGGIALTSSLGNLAATSLTSGTSTAGTAGIAVTATAGNVTVTNAVAQGNLAARSGGTTAIQTATAGGNVQIDAGGAVFSNAATAGGDMAVTSGSGITAGTLTATAGDLTLTAATTLTANALSAGLGVDLATTSGDIIVGTATAGAGSQTGGPDNGRSLHVRSGGDAMLTAGTASTDIGITAAGAITAGSLTAPLSLILLPTTNLTLGTAATAGQLYIANASVLPSIGVFDRTLLAAATPTPTGGFVSINGPVSAFSVLASAGGPLNFASIFATDSADLRSATGSIIGDTLFAGRIISLAAAGAVRINSDIAVGQPGETGGISVTAADIALNALGDLRLTSADATNGNLALTSSGGAISIDRATATNSVLLASGSGVGGAANGARSIIANTIRAGFNATVTAFGPVSVNAATAGGTLLISSASSITLGTGSAGFDTNLFGAGPISAGSVTTGRNFTADTGGAIGLSSVTAGSLLTASSSGSSLTAGTLQAGDDINLSSAGNLAFTNATSTNGDVSANSRGDLFFGRARAGGSVLLAATGGVSISDDSAIDAGDSISVTTGLDLALRALTAVNNLTLGAGGALGITDATATAGVLTLTAGGTLNVGGTGRAGTAAAFTAGGSIGLSNVTAGTTITARSTGGTLNAGTLRAGDDMTLTAAGDLSLSDGATTRGGIALTGAAVRVNNASAAASFSATASDTIDIAAPLLTAGRAIMLDAGGALTTGGLRATNSITASSEAAIRIGDAESIGGTVRATAGSGMTIGNVRAAGSIFLTATAAIGAGDLTAGTGPILPGEGAMTGIGGSTGGGVDTAPAGIAAGFDDSAIVRCDDCFTSAVGLPFLVNYFGNTYDTTYVSNNGYLTFNTGQGTFTPTGLGSGYRGQPIIAAFFADVDTRNALSRQTTYGEGTFAGRQAFGATYDNVGYFSNQADKLNSFQIVLTNRADTGTGNFDIYYNYTNIRWETGSASGGSNGFGGVSAAVGFNAGTGGQPGTFFELAGSRVPGSFLNTGPAPLITTTNNGTPGQLVFMVRNGQIVTGGAAERPSIHVSNIGGATPADINLGNLSAEAAEVHGSGAVTVGNVAVGDRGSGIAATGQPYATVLDAATNLTSGNIMSTGLVALGAREGDLLGGTLTTASSAAVLVGGAVELGAVTTGRGAGDSLFVSAPSVLGDGGLANFAFTTLLGSTGFDPATLAAATPDRIGGALTIDGPVSTGNFIAAASSVTTLDAIDAANRIFVDSGGDLNSTSLAAGGDITANTDQDLVFDTANAGGSVTLAAGGTLSPIDDGSITAGSSISATTGLDLAVGSLTANDSLTLRSGGALMLGNGVARNGNLTLTAARGLTVTGNASAGDDAVLTAGGAISTGAVTGRDTVSISSTGDNVTVTDLLATNGITARALGNLFVRDAVVNATNGNVQLTGGFPFAATANAAPFLLTGNTTVTGTVSAGSVTIQGGGDVSIGTAGRIRSDGTILIASGDDIVVDGGAVIGLGQIVRPITAGQVPDRVGGPPNLVTLSAGSLRGGTANTPANGPSGIVMNGTVDGLQLALNSETIDIGTTGRAGSALTTAAVFTNTGTGRTIVGGAGDATNYALSNSALGRTRGQAIRVAAPADVTVQTLGLTGSAATDGNLSGTAASFEIATPGSVSVEGAATISSAAQSDLFAITAGNRITVLTPSGSIALNGAGTSLGGRIRLAAPRIAVASQPAITAIEGLTDLDAKDERLADNDGTLSDAGFLQANAIEFRVSNGLYIQNSGATRVSEARRGFTAGAGGVTIVTTGTSPAEIAINGRQAQADGIFITGKTLIDRLTLSGTGQAVMASFNPRSTVNGCLITGMTCRFDGMAPSQPIQDVIDAIIDGQDDITGAISSVVQQLNSPLIELIDFTPFRLAGIIDEPVTGAGNDDFYTSFAGEDDFATSGTINEQVTGTGNDLVTDEQVTGTGKDQATKEEPDGQCDPNRKDVDPDCK